ncbi:MAG: ribonuclease H [Bdellovibrionota bacterium]
MALPYPNSPAELLKTSQNLILTDGAARGNPGPAGWAYILLSGEKDIALEGCGFSPKDTNNRMEMLGALNGLLELQKLDLKNPSYLVTDSNFIIDALKKWRFNWKKNNWVKSDGNPVLSVEIWKELDIVYDVVKPKLFHIDAHKGHPGNTRCDLLAVETATQQISNLYKGKLSDYPHFQKISFTEIYPSAHYLCWKKLDHKTFKTWPEAQKFMASNPGFKTKKIFSPEEINSIIRA